jgi:hypothetical protein
MNKKYIILAIAAVLVIVLVVFLILKSTSKKEGTGLPAQQIASHTPKPGVVSQNQPVTVTKIEDEKIKIDYFPETKIIYVYIEANSEEEYQQKVPKAVKILRDSGFDTCDPNIMWPKPMNLNKKLKAGTFELINQLTCPQNASAATGSAQ